MDSRTSLDDLKNKIKKFCEDRDWDQFHNPKDLAIGLITESSELLEYFRFKSEKESLDILSSKKSEISEELADILFMLLRIAQKYEIDLAKELENKLKKNEIRYPINKSKGSNKKYDEL